MLACKEANFSCSYTSNPLVSVHFDISHCNRNQPQLMCTDLALAEMVTNTHTRGLIHLGSAQKLHRWYLFDMDALIVLAQYHSLMLMHNRTAESCGTSLVLMSMHLLAVALKHTDAFWPSTKAAK